MSNIQVNKINWNFIVDKIEANQSVLILGPDFFVDDKDQPLHKNLVKYLDIENNGNILKHYKDDDFFLFDDAGGRTFTCYEIKTFYDQISPSDILTKVAQIPFSTILTLTPDLLLNKAFDQLSIPFQYDHHKRHREPSMIKSPSLKFPLVYNLFGSIDDEESMVLTHDDMFDYFESVFSKDSIPDKLKMALRQAKNYIFLGIPFDKWYMQLLLRLLNIHKKQYAFKRYAIAQNLNDELLSFCSEQFNIDFVHKDTKDFILHLHKLFEEKGELRSDTEQHQSFSDKITGLIANGELDRAIEMLKAFLKEKSEDLYTEAIGIASKYRRLQRKINMGTLDLRDEQVEMAKITESLIELSNEARDFE